jgi:hypothetical protein
VGKLHSHLIYVDEVGAQKSEPTGEGPFIGIWWAEAHTIVAILQSASSVRTRLPLIDSDFEHWREWDSICQHFNKTQCDEYFDISRGRVLVRRNTGRGLIYHGDATPGATLKRIANLFRLSTWTAVIDDHYRSDFDDLFDD